MTAVSAAKTSGKRKYRCFYGKIERDRRGYLRCRSTPSTPTELAPFGRGRISSAGTTVSPPAGAITASLGAATTTQRGGRDPQRHPSAPLSLGARAGPASEPRGILHERNRIPRLRLSLTSAPSHGGRNHDVRPLRSPVRLISLTGGVTVVREVRGVPGGFPRNGKRGPPATLV